MTKIYTGNMSRREWLALRKTGIGGSDAGAVCGVNPFRSAFDVWLDKTSGEIKEEDSEAMRQGRDLEEYAAERFTEETGIKVKRTNYFYRSDKNPFMTADPDRLIVGENAALECKTCSAYSADKWSGGKIPESYEIQCAHYMSVLDLDRMYIACVILGKGFEWRKIERDRDFERSLILLEKDFWENKVLERVIPDPDGSGAYDKALEDYFIRKDGKKSLPLKGFDRELERRRELTELIEKMETERNVIDQKIKLFMEDSESAVSEKYRISWPYTETSRLDIKRLKEERPDIYKEYVKVSGGRRFTVRIAA